VQTRTGHFPIGFRRGGSEWQRDLDALIAWTQEQKLEVIDLGRDGDRTAKAVIDAGLRVGSIDLLASKPMISPDKGKRAEAVAQNAEYVRACAVYGPVNFFIAMLPENPELPRAENFGYMVESFAELAPVLEQSSARLGIEGLHAGRLSCAL